MADKIRVLQVEVLEESASGVRCRTKSGRELIVCAEDLIGDAAPPRIVRTWSSPTKRAISIDKDVEEL